MRFIGGASSEAIMEVSCKSDPVPDLYNFDAELKLVSQDK